MSHYLIAHIGHTTKWVEHVTWWKPDSRGYSFCINRAGEYEEDEATDICRHGGCIAVRRDVAATLARSTPYCRRSDGTLDRLYDGGDLLVVPNGRDEWIRLMAARLDCGKTEKPTPIGAKARAIYLPPATPQGAADHGR